MSSIDEIMSLDAEKRIETPPTPDSPTSVDTLNRNVTHHAVTDINAPIALGNKFLRWAKKIERKLGLESRGIQRVTMGEQSSKTTLSFLELVIFWFSFNTAAQNITLASIGRGVFGLGFIDATLCSLSGAMVGCIPVAYTATWGPWSGNRTMICARFSMGWWPVKLCVLLNLVLLLGYSMIGAVVAGQILSAVSPNASLSIEVGIIIVAVLTFLITTFGIKIFHYYERYAWIPQAVVFLILAGCAGPHFDVYSPSKAPDGTTLIGNRLSFFSVCLSSSITYAPCAADFLVYCDPKILPTWKVFSATILGLYLSFALTFTIGCGLASGLENNPIWNSAGTGTGALIAAGFDSLGTFGKFCSVVAAMGLISNMVPPMYCFGIDFQILGRYPTMIPRFIWNTIGILILAICGLAGRDHLSAIFTNFLALMGYWVVLWIVISLEEQFVFRRRKSPTFVWSDWDKQKRLPLGLAAMASFCLGFLGATLCMAQAYFIGPLAGLVGENGADMGNYVGFILVGLLYPPLRYWELKRIGR